MLSIFCIEREKTCCQMLPEEQDEEVLKTCGLCRALGQLCTWLREYECLSGCTAKWLTRGESTKCILCSMCFVSELLVSTWLWALGQNSLHLLLVILHVLNLIGQIIVPCSLDSLPEQFVIYCADYVAQVRNMFFFYDSPAFHVGC